MNNILRTFLLALVVLNLSIVGTAQQQPPSVQDAIDRMRATLDQLEKDANPPEPPKPVILSTEAELDAAYTTAADLDILTLDPALVYTKPFVVVKPITIQSAGLREGRMDRSAPLPRFMNGIVVAGENITLRGLEARLPDPRFTVTNITGAHVVFDRMRILGDPDKGARRCVTANSGGDVAIVRSYIADCFQVHPGDDSQGIVAWSMLPGLLIEDDYVEGGSESIMFGGGDSSDEAHLPRGIVIRHNTITKNPAWKTKLVGVKNILEFKAADGALVEDNDLSESWGKAPGNGGGQGGYAVVLTVHNQDGRAPWTTIRNVVIRNNRITHAAAAFVILGLGNVKETKTGPNRGPIGQPRPSVRMSDVTIADNQITGLDRIAYSGDPKLNLIQGGPINLTFDHNLYQAVGSTSAFYLGNAESQNLNITRNTYPVTLYGIFLDAVGRITAANWATAVRGGELSNNVVQ